MAGSSRLSRRRPKGWATLNSSTAPALWLKPGDTSTLQTDGAASFTAASSQKLSVDNNASFNAGADKDVWFSFFLKMDSLATTQIILCKGRRAVTHPFSITFETSTNRLIATHFSASGNAGQTGSANNSISSTSNWYHVFVAIYGSRPYIYVNGSLSQSFASTSSSAGVYTNSNPFTLASDYTNVQYANCLLDSCCLGVVTSGWLASNAAALLSYLYNGGAGRRSSDFIGSSYYTGGNPSGAVSWWDLDEVPVTATTLTQRKDRIGTNHLTDNNYVGYVSSTVCGGLVQYDGDPITTFQDRSGNSRHATTNSAATRPIYKTNVVGVKAGIQLDGVDDLLATSSYSKGPSYTIIAVVRNTDATTGDRVISSAPGIHTLRYGNTRSFQNFSFNNASIPSTQASFPITATNTNIVSLVVSTEATLYTNGQKAVSIPTNGTGNSASVATTIGSVNSGSYLKGTLLEYIEYGSALTDAQRTTLERTLAQDYGVSTYPETSNTKAYLNYYAGDPGLGLNENWNVSFGSYPLNVIQGFVS